MDSLIAQNNLKTTVEVIEMVAIKGCKISNHVVETALQLAQKEGHQDLYLRIEKAAHGQLMK